MEQIAAVPVVDQGGCVDGFRPPVEAVSLGVQELGSQRRGPDVGEWQPLGAGDFFVLQRKQRRLSAGEVEREAEVDVLVGRLALGWIGVDVVDVDVDRSADELWGRAQVRGAEPGFLAQFPQGRGQQSPVVLDVATRSE
jgi:hypothetical protein